MKRRCVKNDPNTKCKIRKNSKISLFVNHHFDKLNHIEFKLNFGKLVNQDYGK